MATERSVTHAEKAGVADYLTGDVGDDGQKLENGEPVMVTETEKDDDSDDED